MENEPGTSAPAANVQKPLINSSVTQGFIAATSLFPCIISGAILGYTGLSIWDMPLTYRNSTWFASLAFLGAAVGCLIAQSMVSAFGPRGTLLLSHVIGAIGWVLAVTSLTTTNFLTGRVLTGIFVGLVSVSASVYSAECFPARHTARPVVYMSFGVLFVYLAGSLLNYAQAAAIALIATAVSFVLVRVFVPESPAWLESRGRIGDAEYSKLKLRLVTQSADDDGSPAPTPGIGFIWKADHPKYRSFLALCVHFALQQMSGPLVLVAYASQLVDDSGIQLLNKSFVAVILAAFLLGGSLMTSAMRHPESTATLSSAVTVVGCLLIAAYSLLHRLILNRLGSQLLSFVPLFGLIAFMTVSCTALVPNVPVKNAPGEHVAMAFSYVVASLVIKAYPYVHSMLGWWVFVFFAVMAALNVVFGVLVFNESKSKSKHTAGPAV